MVMMFFDIPLLSEVYWVIPKQILRNVLVDIQTGYRWDFDKIRIRQFAKRF